MSRSSSISRQVIDDAAGTEAAHALSALAVAEYIHDISGQLGTMAGQAEFPMLRYLLTMVRLEAEALIKDRTLSPKGTRRARAKSD